MTFMGRFWVMLIILLSLFTLWLGIGLVWTNAGPDFGVFYLAGATRARLYDTEYVQALRRDLFGEVSYFPYLNPPFYALMMSPFALLPFPSALLLWRILSLCVAGASAYLMASMLHLRGWPIHAFVLVASTSSAWTVALGQNSYLLLFILVVGIYCLHRENDLAGGLVLSLLLFKPHTAMLVPVALVAMRRWKAVRSWAVGACLLYVISTSISGPTWPLSYFKLITSRNVFPTNALIQDGMCSLSGMLAKVLPEVNPVIFGLIILALGAILLLTVRSNDLYRTTALAVSLSILLTPYILPYDLLLLAWPCVVVLSGQPIWGLPVTVCLLATTLAGCTTAMRREPIVLVTMAMTALHWRKMKDSIQ